MQLDPRASFVKNRNMLPLEKQARRSLYFFDEPMFFPSKRRILDLKKSHLRGKNMSSLENWTREYLYFSNRLIFLFFNRNALKSKSLLKGQKHGYKK
jgi:hypothetical protein